MTAPGGSDGHVEVDAEIDLDRLEREFGPRLEAIVGRAVQVVDRQFTQLERNVERSSDRIARKIGDGYRDGAKQAVAAIRVLNQQKLEPKIDLDAAKFRRDLKDAHRTGQAFLRANPLKLRVELENMRGLLDQLTQLGTNLRVDVNQARTAARVAHEAAQAWLETNPLDVRLNVDRTAVDRLGTLKFDASLDEEQVRRSAQVAHAAAQAWLNDNPLKVDLDVDAAGFEERMARLTRNRRIRIDIDQQGGGGGGRAGGGGVGGGDDGGSILGMTAKVTALSGVIAGLGGAVGVAGGAIGVLAGGLLAMGPAAGAALTSITVGMKGLVDGAKSFNEQFKDQDEALAKAIGEMMGPMLTAWHDVSSQIKLGFAKDLQPTFQRMGTLIAAIGPQLQQVSNASAGVINDLTSSMSAMTPQLQAITASAADLIKGIAPGIGQMLKGFVDLGAAAAPFMQSIGAGVGSIFGQLGQALTSFSQSGAQFTALMSSFQPMMEGLGAVVAQLVTSLLDMGSAIGPTLGPLFQSLAQGIAALTPGISQLGAAFSTELAVVLPVVGQAIGALATALTPLMPALSSVVNLIGQVVVAVSPLIQGLAGGVSEVIVGIVTALQPLIPVFSQIAQTLGPVFASIGSTLGQAFAALAPAVQVIGSAFASLAPVIGQVATVFADVLGQVITAIGPVIAQVVAALAPAIASLAPIFTTLAPIIGQVATLLAGVLGQAITALAPVVTTVLTTVGEMLKELAPTISQILTLLGDAFGQIISALGPVLLDTIKALMPAFTAIAKAIGQVLQAITPLIPIGVELVQKVIQALAPILPQIATAFANLVTAIAPLLPSLVELAMQVLPVLASFISDVLVPVLGWLLQRFGDLISFIVGTVLPAIVDFVRGAVDKFNDFIDGVKALWHWTEDNFNKVVDFVKGLPDKIRSAASGMWDGIKDSFKGVINTIIDWWNGLEFKIPPVTVAGVQVTPGFTLGVPDIPKLRDGGSVQRAAAGLLEGPGTTTSDSILAGLSRKEFVVNAVSTGANLAALTAINSARGPVNWSRLLGIPGYAGGTTGGNVWGGVSLTSDDQRNGWEAIRTQFPGLTLTSGTRTEQTEGHPDNHNAGLAIDISGSDSDERAAAEWIAKTYPGSRELIHSEGFAHNIKDGKDVGDGVDFYGADQMAAHANHVHWAPPKGITPGVSGESNYGGVTGGDSSGAGGSGSAGGGSGATSKFTSSEAAKKGGLIPVWVENWPSSGLGGGSGSSYSGTTSTGSSGYSGAKTTSAATPAATRASYSAADAAKVKAGKPITTKTSAFVTNGKGEHEAPRKGLKGGDLIDFSNGLAYYRDGTATDGLNWYEIPSIVKPTTVPAPATPTAATSAGAAAVPLTQNADGTWTSPDPEWAKLIKRESGGDAKITQKISDANSANGDPATGLFQITGGTWKANGGSAFAPSAGQATPQQQAQVAATIFNKSGVGPWGGRENEAALRAGLSSGSNSTTTTSTTLPGSTAPSSYAGVTPANPASSTVTSGTPGSTPSLTTDQSTQQTNPLMQAAGFGAPTNKSWFEAVGSDLPSQVLGWGGDALKEVGGEFFDLFGLGGLLGKGVDFGVNAGKAGLESAKKAASTGVQAASAAGAATGNPAAVAGASAASAGWSMFSGPITFQNTKPNDVSRTMGRVMGMSPSTVTNREV